MKQRLEVALGCALLMVAALLWLTPLSIELTLGLAGIAGLAGAVIHTWQQTPLAPLLPPPSQLPLDSEHDLSYRWGVTNSARGVHPGIMDAPEWWARPDGPLCSGMIVGMDGRTGKAVYRGSYDRGPR